MLFYQFSVDNFLVVRFYNCKFYLFVTVTGIVAIAKLGLMSLVSKNFYKLFE